MRRPWIEERGVDRRSWNSAGEGFAECVVEALTRGEAMLSVVIPLLNEVDSLDRLYSRLKAALCGFAPRHEIIFVDDGSSDGSYDKLVSLWRRDPVITVLRFRRNFGKAAALSAGFAQVSGDYIVMMDADLQDQPEAIPDLLAKMDEGYDLVTGWKRLRHDPLSKTLPSKLFNGAVSGYFKLDIHDFNCGLKVMRASAARELPLYGDFHRFIPVLASAKGYRVAECAVEHAPRLHGVSKYGAKRLITGMFDFCTAVLITKFYHKPMHFFGPAGLILTLLGALLGACLAVASLLGVGAAPQPLWMVMVLLLLGGIQIFCTGLIAEMLSHLAYRDKADYALAAVLEPRMGSNVHAVVHG